MPQLAKGGKWVFAWVIVNAQRTFCIPPQALDAYGFQTGERVFFLKGSQRSGGFSIGRWERLAGLQFLMDSRIICEGVVGAGGQMVIPPEVSVQPGDRLVAVRGSSLALGFLARGPIYEEALRHPEVETVPSDD